MSEKFAESVRAQLSGDAVDTSEETIARYGFNRLPGGDRRPSGVVFPASTADVQVILRLAGLHGMSLWPTSTGPTMRSVARSAVPRPTGRSSPCGGCPR
jgi:4-cresol dehydrogenase (hydroxylating) flavoprotein subunit